MKTRPRFLAIGLLVAAGCAGAFANDFPTIDRVLYVEECVAVHPGNRFEITNKCACALDALAREVKFDDYVAMNTAANANSIGGERGSYIRDAESLQVQIKRYKALQTKVQKGCFLGNEVK